MATSQLFLLVAALLFLALRIARAFARPTSDHGPTYEAPVLKLDAAEPPHDVFGELESTLEADHQADARYLRRGEQKEERLTPRFPISRKIALAGVCVAAMVGLPYAHPSLGWLRLFSKTGGAPSDEPPAAMGGAMPSASVGLYDVPGETIDQQARAKELTDELPDDRGSLAREKVKVPPAVKEQKPRIAIDDPSGKGLATFFEKLMRVENKEMGATARILYYGDSIVASDFVSGKLRRMLQDRFGEGGHGYAIIANAWKGFFHIDVSRTATAAWTFSTCVGPYADDGLYGLGCASFVTPHAGVWTEFKTAELEKWGHNVSRFEVEYLKQPGGGSLKLIVDGKLRETISTAGDTEVAWHSLDVPDGSHALRVESGGDGAVRVFGIRMERDEPGITLSALGITGATASYLDKQAEGHWEKVLAQSKADLVILAFGANEIHHGPEHDEYFASQNRVMERVERALPDASYMLVGPPDQATKQGGSGITKPMTPTIVKWQKEIATTRGWAFWNQFEVMGGAGSMWSWVQAGLGSQDMIHPTGHGGAVLGRWQYYALMDRYEQYKAARR